MRDNSSAHRFELDEAGETAFADYRRNGDLLFIDYVEAPPALRGTGASGRLLEAIEEQARSEGRTIVPICAYAAAWFKRRGRQAS